MDKNELAQKHPDLLASIEREAAQAAKEDVAKITESAVKEAVANTIAIMETACGKEAADKVRNLVACGMTPAQIEAAAKVFGGFAPSKPASETSKQDEILDTLKKMTPGAVSASTPPLDNEAEFIKRVGAL